MRLCPTLEGDGAPLITHLIGVEQCLSRQRGFYHKCHRCLFRGKPANFSVPAKQSAEPTAVERNGTAKVGWEIDSAQSSRIPAESERVPAVEEIRSET
jgi:hypothetical protein